MWTRANNLAVFQLFTPLPKIVFLHLPPPGGIRAIRGTVRGSLALLSPLRLACPSAPRPDVFLFVHKVFPGAVPASCPVVFCRDGGRRQKTHRAAPLVGGSHHPTVRVHPSRCRRCAASVPYSAVRYPDARGDARCFSSPSLSLSLSLVGSAPRAAVGRAKEAR